MNVCRNCGTEFEGSYCPQCGAQYVAQKRCPKCGAVVDGRFCQVCGTEYSPSKRCPRCGAVYTGNFCPTCGIGNSNATSGFVKLPGNSQSTEKRTSTYMWVSRLPIIFFLAFGILILVSIQFLTMSTPTRVRLGLRGSTAASGYYYATFSDIVSCNQLSYAFSNFMGAFSITSVAAAGVLFIIGFVAGGRGKGTVNVSQVFGIVAVFFMATGLVCGTVIWNMIPGLYADIGVGVGDFSIGAGPILTTIASAVFLLLTIIFLCVHSVLCHSNQSYANSLEFDRLKRKERQKIRRG